MTFSEAVALIDPVFAVRDVDAVMDRLTIISHVVTPVVVVVMVAGLHDITL